MKKITFDSMPEALSELINKVGRLEKMLSGKSTGLKRKKTQKAVATKKTRKTAKAGKTKKAAPKGKDMIDLQQASRLLKISTGNLYAYVKGKKIPFKKDGRRLYFSKPELQKWNKKKGNASTKANGKSADAVTVAQAAKLLNISAVTLYYHIKKQRIPVVLKKGKSLFYSKKALLDIVGSKLRAKQSKLKSKSTSRAKSAKPEASAKAAGVKKSKPAKTKKVRQNKPVKESKPAEESKPAKKAAKPKKTAKAVKTVKAKKAKKPALKRQPKPKVEQPVQPEEMNQNVQEPETPQQELNNQE